MHACGVTRQESVKPCVKQLSEITTGLRGEADAARKTFDEALARRYLLGPIVGAMEITKTRYRIVDEKMREIVQKLRGEGLDV